MQRSKVKQEIFFYLEQFLGFLVNEVNGLKMSVRQNNGPATLTYAKLNKISGYFLSTCVPAEVLYLAGCGSIVLLNYYGNRNCSSSEVVGTKVAQIRAYGYAVCRVLFKVCVIVKLVKDPLLVNQSS